MNYSHFFKQLDISEQVIVLHCQCVVYAVSWRDKAKRANISDGERQVCRDGARQFAASAREHWDAFLRLKSIREAA